MDIDVCFIERDFDPYFDDVMKEVYIDFEPLMLVPRGSLRPNAEQLLKEKIKKRGGLTKEEILDCITW